MPVPQVEAYGKVIECQQIKVMFFTMKMAMQLIINPTPVTMPIDIVNA